MNEFHAGDRVKREITNEPLRVVLPEPDADGDIIVIGEDGCYRFVREAHLTLLPTTYEITVTLTEEEVRAFGNDRFNRFGSPKGEAIQKVAVACREALGADR